MSNKEFITLPKIAHAPDSSFEKRKLKDDFWISIIHFHLLKFYKEYDEVELKNILKEEKEREGKNYIEDVIKEYIKTWLETKSKKMFRLGVILNLEPKVKYNQKGFYDLKFQHSDWVNLDTEVHKYYCFECKNLKENSTQNLINEYIYVPSKNDGGVYRYFNGKYGQNQNFGGMIGFVLEGDVQIIKNKIIKKMETKFDVAPNGNLLDIELDTIERNDFTFSSIHSRNEDRFKIYHLLFDFK